MDTQLDATIPQDVFHMCIKFEPYNSSQSRGYACINEFRKLPIIDPKVYPDWQLLWLWQCQNLTLIG